MYSRYVAVVYILELDISWSHVGPHFLAPKSVIFFAKSRQVLGPYSRETIFRNIISSLPVNAGWNTCYVMVSHARRSIDTSIVSQSRDQLIQCQCNRDYKSLIWAWNEQRVFNQIIAVWPRFLHPPSCPDTETVPQQIKSMWLVDIPRFL